MRGGSQRSQINERDSVLLASSGSSTDSRECKSHRDGVRAEVVGGSGRIGSQFLRLLQNQGVRAIPRGLSPGCWSSVGDPIYVTIPSVGWPLIFHVTMRERRSDLIWIGNGLLNEEMHKNATCVVPHYGILEFGALPTTSPQSPPTIVYGKHAAKVASLLQADGIQVQITQDWDVIRLSAARKLLWACCLWLFCHGSDDKETPLKVTQVHERYQTQLLILVTELWPQLEAKIGFMQTSDEDIKDTLLYMQQYSSSMPNAIPSLDLAKSELMDRNGAFLGTRKDQPLHYELLEKILGASFLQSALKQAKDASITGDCHPNEVSIVHLHEVGLSVYGKPRIQQSTKAISSAIIVGSGILGSSIAMNLARSGKFEKITIVDQQQPKANTSDSSPLGQTTLASWAWLNGNQKAPPLFYQLLNQLGMEVWHRDPALERLPLWNGALVQCSKPITLNTGYPCEGPLSRKQIEGLESTSAFCSKGNEHHPVYFFPEEGCVDPSEAVRAMREYAVSQNSVELSFLYGTKVEQSIKDNDGRITGLLCRSSQQNGAERDDNQKMIKLEADVIIGAAGIGSNETSLGGIPLKSSPGTIAIAQTDRTQSDERLLSRILVDCVHESHILQRPDGSVAVGGGYLQVGGASLQNAEENGEPQIVDSSNLLARARKYLAPSAVERMDMTTLSLNKAGRPMPQDGFPSVGVLADGLYSAVTHSGVTLGPLLASLLVVEMNHNVDLTLLEPYRPQRFGFLK